MRVVKGLCILGLITAALFCAGNAGGEDLHALLSKFKAETDVTRKGVLLNDIVQRKGAGPRLLALAQETSDVDTKRLAISGIGRAKYEKAGSFLIECLKHEHHWIRANAARAICEIKYRPAIPSLIRLLGEEKDGRVIEQVSFALGRLQAKEAIPELKKAVSYPSVQTQGWILQAIGELGDESDLTYLAHYLYGYHSFVCLAAAHAIELITGEDFGFPRLNGPAIRRDPVREARQWWEKNQSRVK